MANTLVLAYIGSSLTVILLLIVYSGNFTELFNRESVIVEFLQALIGSLGILLTLPLTAAVCAVLLRRDKG
ncbi:MAG: YibE/F family protein [Oscillospiraceae bacterium]|nr:YibE/F family protein [Oscillospiraceae bacterium]